MLRHQHHLAEVLARLDPLVRVRAPRRAASRESTTGASCPARTNLERLDQLGAAAHPRAEQREVAPNSRFKSSVALPPAVAPQVTSRPLRASAATRALEHRPADVLEHHVHALARRSARAPRAAMSSRRVIDQRRGRRAFARARAWPLPLAVAITRAPMQVRDLDRRAPDAAAGADHQHVLAGPQLARGPPACATRSGTPAAPPRPAPTGDSSGYGRQLTAGTATRSA